MSRNLGLEDALQIAMDAELKAQAFYAQAAQEIRDPPGQDLLGRLAAFEQYHYQKLAELARSLQEQGQFIKYKARSVDQFAPLSARGEAAGPIQAKAPDVADILSKAIENEKKAGQLYRGLADETADPKGKAMFRDLANEEKIHQRILEDEFFSISNRGSWAWSGMYGE